MESFSRHHVHHNKCNRVSFETEAIKLFPPHNNAMNYFKLEFLLLGFLTAF